MEKVIFKNQLFYWFLIICLIAFLIWNIYALTTGRTFALIPITIQIILLDLIFIKSKHTKLGIKIWSIFLLAGPSLSILGKILKLLTGDGFESMVNGLIKNLIFLIIGILIFYFNTNTVFVEKLKDVETK